LGGRGYFGRMTSDRLASFREVEPFIPVAGRCVRDVLTPPMVTSISVRRQSEVALSAI
jgi:hypothetical protein